MKNMIIASLVLFFIVQHFFAPSLSSNAPEWDYRFVKSESITIPGEIYSRTINEYSIYRISKTSNDIEWWNPTKREFQKKEYFLDAERVTNLTKNQPANAPR